MIDLIQAPSPNFDARRGPPDILVLHYTGMQSGEAALARLRDPDAKVSAHYLVEEDGRVFQLVPEEHRAWHAGRGVWRGEDDVNAASIGIEVVNPGHEFGYRPFPEAQIAALTALVAAVRDHLAPTGLRRILPATHDAHGVYAKVGFHPLKRPDWYMQLVR